MSVSEQLHWLSCLMQQRARDRHKYLTQIPEPFHWMEKCTKCQIPAAIVKICIESDEYPAFQWSDLETSCFSVATNSAAAILTLQMLSDEYFSINFASWWRRVVRYRKETGFVLLRVPEFFKRSEILIASSVTNIAKNDTTRLVESRAVVKNSEKKRKRVYNCRVCGKPKRGHICSGVAAPPIPPVPCQSERIGLFVPPPLPIDDELEFEKVFTIDEDEPDENFSYTRIHRIGGPQSYNTDTKTCRSETYNTEIVFP